MSARDDEVRRVLAELEVHIADVEAGVAELKALKADDEVAGEQGSDKKPRKRIITLFRVMSRRPDGSS